MKLLLNALIKYLSGALLAGLLLFLPAGTFFWANAWLFLSIPLVLGSWIAFALFPGYPVLW